MKGPFEPYDKAAVLPASFLYSKYKPLNDWLDTPVHVQILDVKLLDVFNLPLMRGLNYRLVKAPRENPRITMNHIAMTRRQVLWSLAQDYQLSMTPIFGDTGAVGTTVQSQSGSGKYPIVLGAGGDGGGSYIDIRSRQ